MTHLLLRPLAAVVALFLSALCAVPAWAQEKNCALVLMHGKWGAPQNLAVFASRIETVCTTQLLEMPWSGRRAYDQPYPVALQEINDQVERFRAQGFKKVLIGGQSFGANACLAYMAERGDADGLLILAPGHVPRTMYNLGMGRTEVDQARTLVAAGQGNETLTMDDLNQGRRRAMHMRAEVLLSYFDPDGLGHMPGTSARFKKTVPVLWVVGTLDPLYPQGEGFAYAKLPPHPKSRFVVVNAGHGNTPAEAVSSVLEWVPSLD